MTLKVKRGLGLLVIAAIGLLLAVALLFVPADSTLGSAIVVGGYLAAGVAIAGGIIGGLGMLAWGLLAE